MRRKISKTIRKVKKPRTSKLLLWIFVLIFACVVYRCMTYDYQSIQDTAVFVAVVGSVGGICGALITKYLNNSNSENIPKIQVGLYKDSMEVRLRYNEEMMKLKQKYSMTDDDVTEIENEFNLDETTDGILDTAIGELNEKAMKAHEDVSIE